MERLEDAHSKVWLSERELAYLHDELGQLEVVRTSETGTELMQALAIALLSARRLSAELACSETVSSNMRPRAVKTTPQ